MSGETITGSKSGSVQLAQSGAYTAKLAQDLEAEAGKQHTMLRNELATLFDDMTSVKYRLHAAICHSGNASAGHYWVWIRDFEKGVWRKYNDENVTEETEESARKALTSGDPYYIAYVRDEDVRSLVSIPARQVATVMAREAGGTTGHCQDGDIEMVDAAATEHVEDVRIELSSTSA
jgi:ubiquitin carboxyl-terminal hydrolase 25/28